MRPGEVPSQSGDAHLPQDGFDLRSAKRILGLSWRRRAEPFLVSSPLSSVCVTVIGSAATEVVRSLATSVTNTSWAMGASFFVPWNVLDA